MEGGFVGVCGRERGDERVKSEGGHDERTECKDRRSHERRKRCGQSLGL